MFKYDVAIIGAGIAGMATALRLQAAGKSTVILEAHGQPGGCAGYYTKKGFNFDVGATTLVDFSLNGVGGELFKSLNIDLPDLEAIDYKLWLPDRCVHLYRDEKLWHKERLEKLGSTPAHIAFWKLMDNLADVFWNASRKGIKLPLQNLGDIFIGIKTIGLSNIHLARYLNFTVSDALKKFGLDDDHVLKAFLGMLIEDTVHASLKDAPLINAALGVTIRAAGLSRAKGGMKSFWNYLILNYKELGGKLYIGHRVNAVDFIEEEFYVRTIKGNFLAKQVISAVPIENTSKLMPVKIKKALKKYIDQNKNDRGGAIVVFLGVPDSEVEGQELTHHQLLYDYSMPLGNGNNMFVSVSSANDVKSAPSGYRVVMLSTHCDLADWISLSEEEYAVKKNAIGAHLINLARKIYPCLGTNALIYEIGTPRTYQTYTGRIDGAVGGIRQNFRNANLKAVPHDIGIKNFRLAGDTTWPGLGTVACILGSRIVARQILEDIK